MHTAYMVTTREDNHFLHYLIPFPLLVANMRLFSYPSATFP